MFIKNDFALSEKEYEAIKNWANNHQCSFNCNYGKPCISSHNGDISITTTTTSMGFCISATCLCGESFELNNV